MKPRTKEQELGVKWLDKHFTLTLKQQKFAKTHCFKDWGAIHNSRKTCFCTKCGKSWRGYVENKVVCPHCGAKSNVVNHSTKSIEEAYFAVMTTAYHMQICKWHVVIRTTTAKEQTFDFHCVGAEFITPSGKIFSVERARHYQCWYKDNWAYGSEFQVRKKNFFRSWSISSDKPYYQSVLKTLKRNGFERGKFGNQEIYAMSYLLSNPTFEMCVKVGHDAVVMDWLKHSKNAIHGYYGERRSYLTDLIETAIKLANRKHIVFDDKDKWCDMKDYMKDLVTLKMDYHNPSILFPNDFQKTHMVINERANKKRERERAEALRIQQEKQRLEEIQRNAEKQKWISKYCGAFTGMELKSGDFTIKPLITKDEFDNEAKHMHHCIKTYYGKEDTLLLSIEHNNKKCETAEVTLLNGGYIQQCRGVHNLPSDYHNTIVGIIREHLDDFMKRINAKVERPTAMVLRSHYLKSI